MFECPACKADLPDYGSFSDIEDGIDQELYEKLHPIRTKIDTIIDAYTDKHGDKLAKGRKIKEEKGWLRYLWWEVWRLRWASLTASAYLGLWVTPAYLLLQPSEQADLSWVWFGLVGLLPLYAISVWLLVQDDTRDLPTQKKIVLHAHAAFNNLGYSILVVYVPYYLIFQFVEFFFTSLGVV